MTTPTNLFSLAFSIDNKYDMLNIDRYNVSISQGPSAFCSASTTLRQLSEESKAAILDKHNELRRRVAKGEETGGINAPQPAAANMRKMVGKI